jgi:hypothetical protein
MAPRLADHLRRQLGRPSPSVVEKLVAEEPTVQAGLTGTGECDFFGADGVSPTSISTR